MARLGLTARDRLAPLATTLKRAWASAVSFVGIQLLDTTSEHLAVPHYASWQRRILEAQVDELRLSVHSAFAMFMEPHDFETAVHHFAEVYDVVQSGAPFMMATVSQFEQEVGSLELMRAHLEVPRYAQLVLQGHFGVGVRHPEWHSARDVERLLSLYRRALAEEKPRRSGDLVIVDTGDAQTLARAVILACFNLLEAFVLGLAHEHAMTNELDANARKKVLDGHTPLEKRIRLVPTLILEHRSADDPGLSPQATAALQFVFGTAKKHRDSFVHCEPGREAKRGYIREDFFHTENAAPVVEATVENTQALVRAVWHQVHGSEGPRWLQTPSSGAAGRAC